jgi:hypothetical protein
MAMPILNKPYTPWHATDVRQTFDLERQRLRVNQFDQVNAAFGASLGLALAELVRHPPVAPSRKQESLT